MTTPALSVILLAPTDYSHIQKTIRHLRAQTRASDIELLIVTPRPAELERYADTWREFHSVRLVSVEWLREPAGARLRGFSESTAPIIAFAEDHAFPSPNWADALIKAHAGPYAAVSVQMQNANPSALSAADMLINFGPFVAPALRGIYPVLPGHNTSYKRKSLASYGPSLLAMLDSETVLHQDLTHHGQQLFLESDAFVAHLNISLWSAFLRHKFLGGRIFGGLRSRTNQWSVARRVLYGLGAPLVPFVRFVRLVPDLKRTRAVGTHGVGVLVAILCGLLFHATGEMLGYWLGPGNAMDSYAPIELFRESQIRPGERQLAFE